MTQSSAPAKIILFGEHAVVYGRPALAVPITQIHADVYVSASERPGIWIDAPEVKLHAELNTLSSDHPLASVIHNFLFLSRPSPFPNLEIDIRSTIPVASGLGSGAAVTVALVRALSAHVNYPMTDEQVNAFTYEIEKLHHGTPSGIDNTVVTYARPVYFVRGRFIETLNVGQPLTLVIGDTGISAPTKQAVSDVRKLWEADKAKWEGLFDLVGKIAMDARNAIESGKKNVLGELMNQNHILLQEMTVSSPELDRLVAAACEAGALGAKMSGGGRGGNMVALAEDENVASILEALKSSGARNTIVSILR